MPGNFNVKKGGFKPQFIVIHHSATTDSGTKNWEAIRKFHIEQRGWADIGYSLGIENVNGKLMILEGRQIGEVGAHAIGFNANSIGICLVGNYDLDAPSEDRMFILASLCRSLQREFKIPRVNVIGHRDTYAMLGNKVEKSCPGLQFRLEDLRSRLIDP